ncbi:MAG TPA: ABC transporter permease [Phototrophicaceae bacterium]|nr:ABC transporter permease [Phototrophicaceae bacterium]
MTETVQIRRSSTPLRRTLNRMRRTTNVWIGSVILAIIVFFAVFAPIISPYNPIAMTPADRLKPPDAVHIFGTDDFGRDVFTRVIYGGRLSIEVGLISIALASTVGTLLGIIAGYYGGWVDVVVMRLIDLMLAFPSILLALAIVAILGRSLPNVMLAVGVATIPIYTRIVRASTLSAKQMDYVLSARAIGAPSGRIMFRHILPNILAPIIVITTNGIAGAIIAGAALSFLGVGAQAPTPEWGIMLSDGRSFLRTASWVTTFPGLAIMVTVLAINLLGDGLRDVLDPRLRI